MEIFTLHTINPEYFFYDYNIISTKSVVNAQFKDCAKETLKIIIVEDEKFKKLRAIALGIVDFLRNVTGKCPHKI